MKFELCVIFALTYGAENWSKRASKWYDSNILTRVWLKCKCEAVHVTFELCVIFCIDMKLCFFLQDIFAVAVSLITGKIVYISDQAASILNCKREVFKNAKFVEFLTPQDVSVFYSFTTPYRLPSWSMCTGAGRSLSFSRSHTHTQEHMYIHEIHRPPWSSLSGNCYPGKHCIHWSVWSLIHALAQLWHIVTWLSGEGKNWRVCQRSALVHVNDIPFPSFPSKESSPSDCMQEKSFFCRIRWVRAHLHRGLFPLTICLAGFYSFVSLALNQCQEIGLYIDRDREINTCLHCGGKKNPNAASLRTSGRMHIDTIHNGPWCTTTLWISVCSSEEGIEWVCSRTEQ